MSRVTAIAEIALAGGLAGLMIGPDSARQFLGIDFNNTIALNVIGGIVIGVVLGYLATLSKTQAE